MSNDVTKMTQDIQERIRELAYLMWESAGRLQGLAMQYWLDAEKEVIATVQAAETTIAPKPEEAVKSGEKATAEKTPKKTK
jgi:hypothetical protein